MEFYSGFETQPKSKRAKKVATKTMEVPSQDNRMYSEEEVLDILRKSHSIEQTSKMDSWITKWFEQFKNK